MTNSEQHSKPLQIPAQFNIAQACTHWEHEGPQDTILPYGKSIRSEKTAIIVDRGELAPQQLSYQQLHEKSNQFSHALAQLNVSKGERVMLWMPNCIEFPIAFFGILGIGAVAVPSSVMLSGDELHYLANDSEASAIVTTFKLWERLSPEQKQSLPFKHLVFIDTYATDTQAEESDSCEVHVFDQLITGQSNLSPEYNTQSEDPAYLVYTSGTTGYPKGVLHAHRSILGRLAAAHHWFDYQGEDDIILHAGKFNWTYVLGTALMDPLLLGKTVVVFEGESKAELWPELIAKHQCSIFIGVPTIYRQILQKTQFTNNDTPSLRHCMCAGEHLSNEVLSLWKQRFNQDIYEAIGMSECSYYLSQHPVRPIRPGSAGFPQPGHKIALLDSDLNPVEDEKEGMLCIHESDPGLFLEYWKLPQETEASRKQGYFLTGDYARRDEDGYVWFHGRRDDIINSFGYRISPHEIERVLKTHEEVSDCVALEENVGPDKNIVATFVIRTEKSTLSESDLLAYANDHLASYKMPKKVYFVDTFPRTANGKIQRKALRDKLSSQTT